MNVYIDKDFKCHAAPGEGLREFDVPFFNGKCDAFIEGFIFVPEGEEMVREDGERFKGEMRTPWKDYAELYIAQLEYELADADAALAELGVTYNA